MALLSQLDKAKLTAEIAAQLQSTDIQNAGTLVITVQLTPGSDTETIVNDNTWDITVV